MSMGVTYHAGVVFLGAEGLDQQQQRIVRWCGRYYRWTGAYYRSASDEEVRSDVTRWLVRHETARTDGSGKILPVTENFVRDVMLAIKTESEISACVQPGSWVEGSPAGTVGPFLATSTGIIDLGRIDDAAAMVLPSSPDFFALCALPFAPDRSRTHTYWDQFLFETFNGNSETIGLLQEMFGYCLWPDCRYEKFFLIHGPAGSGKSTVVETLQALLGESNVSAIPLERLGGRFDLSGLVGKMANIIFDASEMDRTAEGILKALVSGEPVPMEHKHQDIQTVRLMAKNLFATNALPRFHDTSDGIWRRIILLPFDHVCPVNQRDPGLKRRLRSELPAIAWWAIQGLARLRERDGFTLSEGGQQLVATYREESNPVALFLADRCEANPEVRVNRRVLYAAYQSWVAQNGFATLSVMRFNREVRALRPQPTDEVRDGRGGDRMFMGIRVRAEPDILHQFQHIAGRRAEGGAR